MTGGVLTLEGRGKDTEAAKLDPEDLQAVVVADGYPVWLGGCPLYIVDLSLGCVGQDGVLDGPRHLLDVPDESLVIIRCTHTTKAVQSV